MTENVTAAGRHVRKRDVLPVYVGQAENVRTRLQQYGKDGSHLGSAGKAVGGTEARQRGKQKVASEQNSGMFQQAFALGYAVVFRYSKVTLASFHVVAIDVLALQALLFWELKSSV